MTRDNLATPEETLEAELVIIQAAGIKVKHVGYQAGIEGGVHLYDVLEPKVPGYVYSEYSGHPTFTLATMREKGLL